MFRSVNIEVPTRGGRAREHSALADSVDTRKILVVGEIVNEILTDMKITLDKQKLNDIMSKANEAYQANPKITMGELKKIIKEEAEKYQIEDIGTMN